MLAQCDFKTQIDIFKPPYDILSQHVTDILSHRVTCLIHHRTCLSHIRAERNFIITDILGPRVKLLVSFLAMFRSSIYGTAPGENLMGFR